MLEEVHMKEKETKQVEIHEAEGELSSVRSQPPLLLPTNQNYTCLSQCYLAANVFLRFNAWTS